MGIDQLVAFIVTDKAAQVTLEARNLRMLLRERLPAYMVPARMEVWPSLPRTVTGKIDLPVVSGTKAFGGTPTSVLALLRTNRFK